MLTAGDLERLYNSMLDCHFEEAVTEWFYVCVQYTVSSTMQLSTEQTVELDLKPVF